jgi:hypothetical protein
MVLSFLSENSQLTNRSAITPRLSGNAYISYGSIYCDTVIGYDVKLAFYIFESVNEINPNHSQFYGHTELPPTNQNRNQGVQVSE